MRSSSIVAPAALASAFLCGTALLSGCALEHPSMSLDSVSKRPFFGVQVAPKKKEPAYDRTISQDRSRAADAVRIQPAIRETERESHWPNWLTLPTSRPVLSLPRTDQDETPLRTASNDVPIEF